MVYCFHRSGWDMAMNADLARAQSTESGSSFVKMGGWVGGVRKQRSPRADPGALRK